jgi:uncharacterized tellurite resistance protein B-like protein
MGLDVEVCLIEIVAEFELPRTERSLCMVAPAGAVMGLGSRGWSGVLTTLHGALRELHARSGAAVAGWVWERPWRTFSPPHEHQLTLWLAAADAVELDVVAGLCSTAQEPWRCGGMAVRPPFALPALYIAKTGQAYHVWHAGRGGPFTPVLRRAGVRLVRERRRLADAFADQFLPGAHHALGVEERNQRSLRQQGAIILRTVQQVIEADGVIEKAEASFFTGWFTPELRDELHLSTAALVDEAYRLAIDELPRTLSEERRLALLNVPLAASIADGRIDPRELAVIRSTGERLGLPADAVADYLTKIW